MNAKIKQLAGEGDIIMGVTLPFAIAGIIANVLYPQCFAMNAGLAGAIAGTALLVLGVPFWLISVAQMLRYVPQNKLITTGAFHIVPHPIYTSVALLVIPGITLVLDTWVGFAIGGILYIVSRIFRGREEKKLRGIFAEAYAAYRSGIVIPWL